jgi:hypothetical protein
MKTPAHIVKERFKQLTEYLKEKEDEGGCPLMRKKR